MPPDLENDLELQIAHVLFIDIVAYSTLLINEQHECLQQLNEVVRNTDAFRLAAAAGKLISLPTGDGMALAFSTTPDAPVRCALQAAKALQALPKIRVRMGVHSGPVSGTTDLNERSNVAGGGMNIAQRVMDCGDAGHILLSKRVAEDLAQYRHWQANLHPLGDFEVKHGVVLSLVNLYTDELGNAHSPSKLAGRIKRPDLTNPSGKLRQRSGWIVAAVLSFGLVIAALWFVYQRPAVTAASVPRPPARAPVKSIAVLPFANLSANQEAAFFADGVQDEILTDLAKVAALKVISRTSVMQYKAGGNRNLREIAQQLGVTHILEGSVQRVENRIRVNAQLIDARTDAHLWAQTYDRDLADVFAIQSEISSAIAAQLQAKISPSEQTAISQTRTADLMAEKLFVQAREQMASGSNPDGKEALLDAVRLLEEAIARDPQYLRAYSLLITAQLDLYWQGFDHTDARRELARVAIEGAARFAPDAGEVHLARADYAYHGFRDYDGARAELEIARETLPNFAQVYVFAGSVDRRQGRWADATRNFERGIELDPRNFRFLVEAAFSQQALRRYPEARRLYQRALEIMPTDHFARTQLAQLDLFERADPQGLQAELAAILREEPKAATEAANGLFDCAMAGRDAAAAARALVAIRPEGLRDPYNNSLWARDWFVGLAARTFGDAAGAERAFRNARAIEQQAVTEQPGYAAAWSRLGLVDAGLARKDEAVREGLRACELLPIERDALDGPSYITSLAMIYAWVGEKDLAFAQLALSARTPGGVSYGELKLYPQWDPLRDDRRFDTILASLASK